jgi:hypothetical protein
MVTLTLVCEHGPAPLSDEGREGLGRERVRRQRLRALQPAEARTGPRVGAAHRCHVVTDSDTA